MDDKSRPLPPWLPELMDQVRQELSNRADDDVDCGPVLLQERVELEEKIDGWRQSLGNPKLASAVRTSIESDWAAAVERQQQIDAQLAEKSIRDLQADAIIQPEQVQSRLDRLADVLAADNPTMGNLELSLHIDRITCYPNGMVTLRTCKLGIAPDAVELLAEESTPAAAGQQKSPVKGMPRRRNKLRVSGVSADGVDSDTLGYFATDTERFVGLDDSFFWVDTFQAPGEAIPWYIENAEAVFKRRQEEKFSYEQLAHQFERSKPTVMAANRHYLKTHPDAVDAVELAAGGSPKKRMDVGPIADEVRTLWWDKFWPKLRLARKFSCATTTIDRALKLAYAKTGEKVPAEAERRRHIIACLRKQLDEGAQLLDIAREAGISDVTARAWLRKSFEAERKAMPDLRRRGK